MDSLSRPYPPREKWVFNRIIEFSGVNDSNMPYTLTLLQRLDYDFTLNHRKDKKKNNLEEIAFSRVLDIFTKVTLC